MTEYNPDAAGLGDQPAFDTPEWRELRDQKYREWVRDEVAVQFLRLFFDAVELLDDIADQDGSLEPLELAERLARRTLVEIPANQFWCKHAAYLLPLLWASLNAWSDANHMEATGTSLERSYVLRDQSLDVVLYAVLATRGHEVLRELSAEIRAFFLHETLDDYLTEHGHAHRRH